MYPGADLGMALHANADPSFDAAAGKLLHTARYDLEPSAFEDCDSTGLVDLEVLRPGPAGAGGASPGRVCH